MPRNIKKALGGPYTSKDKPGLIRPELLQPITQCPETDPQEARGGGLVPAGLLEGSEDLLFLYIVEVGDQRKIFTLLDSLLKRLSRQLQIVKLDPASLAKRHRPLQDILELSYIARELIGHKPLERRLRDKGLGCLHLASEAIEDKLHQGRDILTTFAQGRTIQLD